MLPWIPECVHISPRPLPHKAYLKWTGADKRNSFPLKKDSIPLLSPLVMLFFSEKLFSLHWPFLIKWSVSSVPYFMWATGHLDARFRISIYHFGGTQVPLLTGKKLSYPRDRKKCWNFYFVLFYPLFTIFNILCLNLCTRI